jgi:hypothetical protein
VSRCTKVGSSSFAVLFHYKNGTRRDARHAAFDRGHAVYAADKTLRDITAATGWRIPPIVAESRHVPKRHERRAFLRRKLGECCRHDVTF